jgi:hypothetical protein
MLQEIWSSLTDRVNMAVTRSNISTYRLYDRKTLNSLEKYVIPTWSAYFYTDQWRFNVNKDAFSQLKKTVASKRSMAIHIIIPYNFISKSQFPFA